MADLLYCSPVVGNLGAINCGSNRGGLLKEVYIANFGDIQSITSSTNDKEYDSIVMNTNPLTSAPYFWYRWVFKKNTASFANEAQIGNNKFFRQSFTFTFEGQDYLLSAVLDEMLSGEAVVIGKDYQGKVHLLGRVAGLELSALTSGTGAGADDLYGGTITFQGDEPEVSNFIKTGTTIEVSDGLGGTTTITF